MKKGLPALLLLCAVFLFASVAEFRMEPPQEDDESTVETGSDLAQLISESVVPTALAKKKKKKAKKKVKKTKKAKKKVKKTKKAKKLKTNKTGTRQKNRSTKRGCGCAVSNQEGLSAVPSLLMLAGLGLYGIRRRMAGHG